MGLAQTVADGRRGPGLPAAVALHRTGPDCIMLTLQGGQIPLTNREAEELLEVLAKAKLLGKPLEIRTT